MATSERDFLSAEIASVERLLADRPETDLVGRVSLEERLAALRGKMAGLPPEREARVLLVFDGKPVRAAGAIDARFSSKVLESYQDLIAKVHAQEVRGHLAIAGPVPGAEESRLYLTDLIAGSCGLQLEEIAGDDGQLALPGLGDTPLKRVVERTTDLVIAAGEGDDVFAERAADMNERILDSLRAFFLVVDEAEATFRIESSHRCSMFDRERVSQARGRVQQTTFTESTEHLKGTLLGLLPESSRFEYRIESGEVLFGRLALEPWPEDLVAFQGQWVGQPSVAVLHVERAQTGAREKVTYHLLRLGNWGDTPSGV